VEIQDANNARFYNLVFGDSTFSTFIMCMDALNNESTGKDLRAALQSVYYDKNLRVDPRASAPFTLDESRSIFKFAKPAASMLMYSIGGVNKESYEGEPFVLAYTLPMQPGLSALDLTDFLVIKLEKYGLHDKEPYEVSNAPVNGKTGCEVVFYGQLNGQRSLVFLQVVVEGEKAIVIQSVIGSDYNKYLKEVRKLAGTATFR
jgi:hypothetical protein